MLKMLHGEKESTQPVFTCSKVTTEILEIQSSPFSSVFIADFEKSIAGWEKHLPEAYLKLCQMA